MQDAHMLPAGSANVAVLWNVVRCLVPSHRCVIRLHAHHAASERNRCHSQAEFKDLKEKKDKKVKQQGCSCAASDGAEFKENAKFGLIILTFT